MVLKHLVKLIFLGLNIVLQEDLNLRSHLRPAHQGRNVSDHFKEPRRFRLVGSLPNVLQKQAGHYRKATKPNRCECNGPANQSAKPRLRHG